MMNNNLEDVNKEDNMEEVIKEQVTLGDKLQQVLANWKKQPIDRRTQQFYSQKLQEIEGLWNPFTVQDDRIKELANGIENHDYFTSNYFQKIANKVNETRDQLKANMRSLPPRAVSPNPAAGVSQTTFPKDETRAVRDYKKQQQIITIVKSLIQTTISKAEASSLHFLELQLATIQQHWKHAQMLHERLWTDEDVQYDFNSYLTNEQEINEGILFITNKMFEDKITTHISEANKPTTNIKLPQIDLPRFDGNYLQWRQFHDLFTELVHNSALPPCQKMMYLKSSLSGEAKGLISHFSTTAANYEAARDVLIERYENKRLIINSILSKLLMQPHTNNENPHSLKLLHDVTNECMLSLQALDIPTSNWDPLLLHILVQRLNKSTHALWEQSLSNPRELPTLSEFLNFLKLRFQSLEVLNTKHVTEFPKRVSSVTVTVSTNCIICHKNHQIYSCPNFLAMSPPDRLKKIQSLRRCVNCLKEGHKANACTSGVCNKCKLKHNSLLHLERATNTQVVESPKQQASSSVTLTAVQGYQTVLLSTVNLLITTANGGKIPCRGILDSGSQANFITKAVAKRLGLSTQSCDMNIEGIGQCSKSTTSRINIEISSLSSGYTKRLNALVIPKIVANQPLVKIDTRNWKIPHNITLADTSFNEPGPIEVLIGSEIFFEILSVGQISLGKNMPTLQNSLFGWLVAGVYDENEMLPTITCGICIEDVSLDAKLERFWQIDEGESKQTTFTAAERKCENYYVQTTRRANDGRYVVNLPFQLDRSQLGESSDIALQRFKSIERKFRKDSTLKEAYIKFMQEYEQLGHMVKIPQQAITQPHFFLPHHAVLRPDSTTTKLRVVFDASAKTSTNLSLNDVLSKGPSIQDDVFSILVRFRLPRFAFTADIEKMYRQIWVDEADQTMQLIWWREDESKPLNCYQLKTITYGTSAAPYLAIRTLRKIAEDMSSQFPLAAEAIKTNFYVDDALCGSDKLHAALKCQTQLIDMLKSAGMRLRKWVANHPRLLENIHPQDQETELNFSSPDSAHVKTMGLIWDPSKDQFKLKVTQNAHKTVTKRTILSEISQIFDPLGFIAPVTATAKIFLQKLWQLKLDWDASLPQELHSSWMQIREEFEQLQNIRVDRHVCSHEIDSAKEVHIFSDASERAYGAVAYMRSTQPHNTVTMRFLCAKSKVAPVKQITLPRLELCAAKLAADLFSKLQETEYFQNIKIYFWTDSTAVLGWINSESANYHTFIANRISAIQRVSSSENWRHVRSEDNPADLVSRGLTPSKLINNSFWFYGPRFLHGSLAIWPLQPPKGPCSLELRKTNIITLTTVTAAGSILEQINHRNSFHCLQRIVAYILKFKYRSMERVQLDQLALEKIIKIIQINHFKDDIKTINEHHAVKNDSSLSSLNPFLDQEGILRVGGRLEASRLSYDAKHPIILPGHHPVTKLLIETIHKDHLHVGPQTLMSIVRQKYWPIKLKMVARSIVNNCVRCVKAKPKLMNQLMGQLPAERVQPHRPFVISGVDFFGPVWTHFKIRGKKPLKAYVAVFCCFATKAVHMELVNDLTTQAFIGALKRFMSRRGHCSKIYCDNATNFVGAKNYIEELYDIIHSDSAQQQIQVECSKRGIEFAFIPPRAPHFGGLWEAAVKSAKKLLISTLTTANLTYEEMETLIIEAEAILNSRPLTPMSSDPNDLQALTPGHFLIGEPLISTIDPRATTNKTNVLTRWKLVNQLKSEFWRRWSTEYLCTLQNRFKWKKETNNIKPGTMVIIKEDNLPATRWPLGRIVKTIPGEDGLVRVADVKTATNIARRSIHRLASLPIRTDDDAGDNQNEDSTTESSKDAPTHKRRKLSNPSTMLTIIMICLLPLCFGNPVEIQPFGKSPGMYFERIGDAGITASEWTLISYIDMRHYWKKFKAIKQYPEAIIRIGNESMSPTGKTVVNLLKGLVNELDAQNQLLRPQGSIRKKRGAFNVVGNIANSLFGVLDATYAEETAKTIEKINQNENYLVESMKNQTSFLDATLNILDKNQKDMSEEIDKIIQVINQLKVESPTQLMLQATLDMLETERIQDSLLEILVSSHHGKISPQLISPAQLQTELQTIKASLPNHIKLPSPTDELLNFYKLMTIEGRPTENYVIFKITIPLIVKEDFEILKIASIPWISNGTFYQIKSTFAYLIINLHRDEYLPLKESELSHCLLINQESYICHEHYPFYKKGSAHAICEVQLLLSNNMYSSCDVQPAGPGPHWIQLHNPNVWIYSVKDNYVINTVCGTNPKQITLKQAGVLKLQPDCSIKQASLTIQGYQKFETTRHRSYTPELDSKNFFKNITLKVEELQRRNKNNNDLDAIHKKLSELRIELPTKIRPHDIHHYTMSYVCLAVLICIAVIMALKYKNRNHKESITTISVSSPNNAKHETKHEDEFITISS